MRPKSILYESTGALTDTEAAVNGSADIGTVGADEGLKQEEKA
jgi:hypothetical protein